MEARWRVEFTGVELTGGVKLTALVEKAATGSVKKATVGPRALEGRSGLLAPHGSHPRLPPAWCTGLRHRARLPRAARPTRMRASRATVSSHARGPRSCRRLAGTPLAGRGKRSGCPRVAARS
jgi:hypothetical protein